MKIFSKFQLLQVPIFDVRLSIALHHHQKKSWFHFLVVVAGETEDQQVVVVAAVPLPVRAAAAVVLVAAAAPVLPGGVAQVRQGSGLHAHLSVIFLCPVTSLF